MLDQRHAARSSPGWMDGQIELGSGGEHQNLTVGLPGVGSACKGLCECPGSSLSLAHQ
jgi:hypothetical protein